MIYSASEEKCWDRFSIPSRRLKRWKTNAYTAWCPLKKKSHGSGSKKCLFLPKKMDEFEEAFAWNMVRIYIKILLTLRNRNIPWGLNDFVPVCYCLWLKIPVQSVPISTPQTLAPQGLLPRRLRPCQGVQSSCSEVAHDLKLMARNAGTDSLYPSDENQLFSMPKETWLDLPTTTVADTSCWQPQIRKRWVAGISCEGLSPTDSPRELPWNLQQLQPTAATNSLAAETAIASYRVHERPRWVWNKRIHRMRKKKRGNV